MRPQYKIIFAFSLIIVLCTTYLAYAQKATTLNAPALLELYQPYPDFPEGYESVCLTDILYRSCPSRGLEPAVIAYWQAVKAASDWKYYRLRAEKINALNPQTDSSANLFLQKTEGKAAISHLKMRRCAIELNAMAGDCGFSPDKLPYCNEMPHIGVYHTNIEPIAKVRYVSGEMRLLARRIEIGYEQLKASASAVASAVYYVEAQTELLNNGKSTVIDLINAFEQEELAREEFWQSVLSYNQDIVRYVILFQTGQAYNPKTLASLLLLKPRRPSAFESTQSNNPKSVLEQRPDTFNAPMTTPDPEYPSGVNTDAGYPSQPTPAPVPDNIPADDVNPLPTAPTTDPSYSPVIKNDAKGLKTEYRVGYTPSSQSGKLNWFDVSIYKSAGAQSVTLKDYIRYFSSGDYQQATNVYWRTAAQCQKLAAINVAIRHAEDVQQKIFAMLTGQGKSEDASLFLLSMNVWKQILTVKRYQVQKEILGHQFNMNLLLSKVGIYSQAKFWPVTPFHTLSYQITDNDISLERDATVRPLADSIAQEFNLMNQTKSALEQASAIIDRDVASGNVSYKTILLELQNEYYFANAYLTQTVEYNFSIGNYVQRWMYARNNTLSLDDFCRCLVTQME